MIWNRPAALFLAPLLVTTWAAVAAAQVPLDPTVLTKYIDPLPEPRKIRVDRPRFIPLTISEFQQQLHGELRPTTVWGYDGTYPGPTFEAFRGNPAHVLWLNQLFFQSLLGALPVDRTLHWANPLGQPPGFTQYLGPVPTVTHLHGGEDGPGSDGHPEAWFTPFFGLRGPGWQQFIYDYGNTQEATTLWYHDHALGVSRLSVYAGLAGFYLLRDPANEPRRLPQGSYEREILIQDRLFDVNGQLRYPDEGDNPTVHPFWVPEVFGDTIVVNGKIWPYLEVEPRRYRFRLLNGSNARFYTLSFEDVRPFVQIGTDGGYLESPVPVDALTLAPGERADVIVDFADLPPGAELLLTNSAAAPFPAGDPPDPATTEQIMQFRVIPRTGEDRSRIPLNLRPRNPIVPIAEGPIARTRTLTLNEVLSADGNPLGLFLDGRMWEDAVTEVPTEGTTEIWEGVNLTGDTHPIHLHLVQFQILSRQAFRADDYRAVYEAANPPIPFPVGTTAITPPVEPFLEGPARAPDPNEAGWKDTVRMNPGEVTRIVARFAPTSTPLDEEGRFRFDPSRAPGYVWHCHILEHEDNEMMRPYAVRRD